MAVAITAVYNGESNSPGVDLTITGLSGSGTVTVRRIDNTAEDATMVVRGFSATPQTGSTMVGEDFEAPINRSIKYRVEVTGDQDDSADLTIPYSQPGDVWIKSIADPMLSRKVCMGEWSGSQYPARIIGKYEILGRKNPVVLTDVFGNREGEFTLLTYYSGVTNVGGTFKDLEDLLINGGTLLIQCADNDFTGESDMYFEVESLTRTRLSKVDASGRPAFTFKVSYIEVDQPSVSATGLGTRSYQDVLNENASYQAILDEYSDYLDLVQRAPN